MQIALFNGFEGILFLLRWMHFFFGIVWIGLLYYFNFVHGAFMAEADAAAKPSALTKLLPRALWWFRWGAMWTMVSGLLTLMIRGHQGGFGVFTTSWGVLILIGTLFGLTMWFNVWFVIWPCQKVVIANAENVAAGKPADPNAAASAARASLASRTNTLMSVPLLFFMGAASHLPVAITAESNLGLLAILVLIVWAISEGNGLKGKMGPIASIKGVIHMGFVMTVILYIIVEMCA